MPLEKNSTELVQASASNTNKSLVYPAIDSIRFISICSIIWGHCFLGWNRKFHGFAEELVNASMIQLGRLGTISFFLISGFLMADKIDNYTPGLYFKKRWRTTYVPFLIFLFLFLVYRLEDVVRHFLAGEVLLGIQTFYRLLIGMTFYSSYWFIPVFFISTLVMVLFKKFTRKLWFGALLGALTLLYFVDLHQQWFSVSHSKALFGYMFFIWLGMYMNENIDSISNFLKDIAWYKVLFFLAFTFFLACYEGTVLMKHRSVDPFSSLRATNALFGICFFFFMIKKGPSRFINRLKPRDHVYGMYLVQNIVVFELMGRLNPLVEKPFTTLNIAELVLIQCLFYILILGLNYFITMKIAQSPFAWIVGSRRK